MSAALTMTPPTALPRYDRSIADLTGNTRPALRLVNPAPLPGPDATLADARQWAACIVADPTASDEERELASAIRQQAEDDARHRCRPLEHETIEADLVLAEDDAEGFIGRIADPRPLRGIVGASHQWNADTTHYEPRRGPCPGCHDRPMGRAALCLVCSAGGDDPAGRPARKPMRNPLAEHRAEKALARLAGGTGAARPGRAPKAKPPKPALRGGRDR